MLWPWAVELDSVVGKPGEYPKELVLEVFQASLDMPACYGCGVHKVMPGVQKYCESE